MSKEFIHFFGTTGNKDIFFKNIRQAGGLYLCVDETKIVIDPGVNTFYKYIRKYTNDIIDGIVLSHIHIDHSNDLNIFVELMTNGGHNKSGTVLVPRQAIEEKVLYEYVREFPENLFIIKSGSRYKIGNIEITSSIEHKHGIENYGFKFKTKNHNIGLITDTAYFSELPNSYMGCDILIINVPYYKQKKSTPKHLDIFDVEKLIQKIEPGKVVLTHFCNDMLKNNPILIAKSLSDKYKIEVVAAEDDMILNL